MRKMMKPGRRYFIINTDESYAKKIFEILKKGQIKKGEWPEGKNITFEQWKKITFPIKVEPKEEGLSDIIEGIADLLGIYGIGIPNEDGNYWHEDCNKNGNLNCRLCFVEDMKNHIIEAVERNMKED